MKNLISTSLPDGNTWTLTTLAISYLNEAEQLYGSRPTEYLYGGVEVTNNEKPHIYFLFDHWVIIRLTNGTADNLIQAIFQMSHEIIHILSPLKKPTTNNLEEGLATYFSILVTDRDGGDPSYAKNAVSSTNYQYPYELVLRLLAIRPDAILELRKIQAVLGLVQKDDFIKANLAIPDDLIKALVQPMNY